MSESPIFQAIGVIVGDISISKHEKGYKVFTVSFGGKEYQLVGKPKQLAALKQQIQRKGANQTLVVYPRITHYPKRDTPYKVSFQLVAFNSHEVIKELSHLEFKLSGLWQFIPVCKTPCISVFRNFSDSRLEYVKQAEPVHRVRFMKANHIPLFWRDSVLPPFRFNPKTDKDVDQGKPFFFALKAKFIPSRDTFGFTALMSPPLESPPKFLKASKKDKTTVQQEKKKKIIQLMNGCIAFRKK